MCDKMAFRDLGVVLPGADPERRMEIKVRICAMKEYLMAYRGVGK